MLQSNEVELSDDELESHLHSFLDRLEAADSQISDIACCLDFVDGDDAGDSD